MNSRNNFQVIQKFRKLHTVELFPQVNYCKTLENFRENASLNESTIKQPFENCNFRKFRPKLRSPGLNMTFSIHIRDLASVEKPKMFAEV